MTAANENALLPFDQDFRQGFFGLLTEFLQTSGPLGKDVPDGRALPAGQGPAISPTAGYSSKPEVVKIS